MLAFQASLERIELFSYENSLVLINLHGCWAQERKHSAPKKETEILRTLPCLFPFAVPT